MPSDLYEVNSSEQGDWLYFTVDITRNCGTKVRSVLRKCFFYIRVGTTFETFLYDEEEDGGSARGESVR